MRCAAVLACSIMVFSVSAHAQELPQSEASFEVEPPLLVPAESSDSTVAQSESALPSSVEKLESDLARAKKRAASAERLFRAGILSKLDAEKRALRVVHLEEELAQARVEAAKNSGAQDDAALAQLVAAARQAKEKRQRADFEAAALNVKRQRMLLALGSARKSDVARAEEKLASLQKDNSR